MHEPSLLEEQKPEQTEIKQRKKGNRETTKQKWINEKTMYKKTDHDENK